MIKDLVLTNFRGHSGTYQFGPGKNFIKGKNESGKSSIKEAISFAWMGMDSDGSRSPDHMITMGLASDQDYMQVNLATSSMLLKRRKFRGRTSEVKVSFKGLPEIQVSQTDLMKRLKVSQEVFMSSWSVGYFMKLRQDQKLKVLGEVAKIDRRKLLRSLLPKDAVIPAQVKLINPRIDVDVVAGLRRLEQNSVASYTAQLKGLTEALKSHVNIEIKPELHQHRISILEETLAELDLNSKLNFRFVSWLKRVRELSDELTRVQKHLHLLESQPKGPDLEFLRVRAEQLLRDEQEALKEESALGCSRQPMELLQVPVKPDLECYSVCPTCSQLLTQEAREVAMEKWAEETINYNKIAREIADHNKIVDDKLEVASRKKLASRKERAELLKQINELAAREGQGHTAIQETQARIIVLKQMIEAAELEKPVEPKSMVEQDERALKEELHRLRMELHTYNTFASQDEKLRGDIEAIEKAIHDHKYKIVSLVEIEKGLVKLPEVETAQTLEKFSIPGAVLSLTEGELLITDAKGVDYRCLSDGRRMKIDIALCMAIKAAAGPAAPDWIFVDNSDLMDDFETPEGVQTLVAIVSDSSSVEVTIM